MKKSFHKLILLPSILFASVLTFACNNYSYKDDVPTSSVSYTSVSTLQKDDCDLSKIKKVKLYNYCCNSGWANTPATLTIYGKSSSYTNVKDTDSFFEDLPFSDFVTDVYGQPLEWTSSDTGVYNGSVKTLNLSKLLDMSDMKRIVLSYSFEATSDFVNGGGIQICFVDKNGNESNYIYISSN